MKVSVNGRELEIYELSNEELVKLYKGSPLDEVTKSAVISQIVSRFEYGLCKGSNETEDDVFVRQFSDFVNGKMYDKHNVAEKMAREHRYLQNEMFKVCIEYIKVLAENGRNGYFDGRNEYACTMSKNITDLCKENGFWI